MSGKDVNDLIRKGEQAEIPISEALAKAAEDHAQQQLETVREEKNKRRRALIKFGSMSVLAAVILVFATASWFTMNKSVESGGMGMKIGGQTFEITMLENSKDGIFKDPYHILVHEDNAIYWEMTADNNMINYNEPVYNDDSEITDHGDRGIRPGTEGVISFYVTPKVDSVDLEFNFEMIGYQKYVDDNGTENDKTDDKIVMNTLEEVENGNGMTARNLLNGHILLFEKRDKTLKDGKTVITYSDPILSDGDMHRVFNRTISGKDTAKQVDIFWVWPSTLSTLVDASDFPDVITLPFTSGTSYDKIIGNIHEYPHYYLKGASASDEIDAVNDIAAHYDLYGDMYDQGDNEIGMRVNYVLLKLSVKESSSDEDDNGGN